MDTITIPRAESDALKDENAELNQKVEWLMEQLRLLKKKRFGVSSEQTSEDGIEQLKPAVQRGVRRYGNGTQKPNRSPAKRVRFGEEGQGSGARNARRAFRDRADFALTRWSTIRRRRSWSAQSAGIP